MGKKLLNRLLSLFMVLSLVVGVVPDATFAQEGDEGLQDTQTIETTPEVTHTEQPETVEPEPQQEEPAVRVETQEETKEEIQEQTKEEPKQEEAKILNLQPKIVQFDLVSPVAQLEVEEGEELDLSSLPTTTNVVVAFEDGTVPSDFEVGNFSVLPEEYKATPVANVYKVQDNQYRIYGTLYDKTGWFSSDDKGNVNGLVKEVGISWDASSVDTSKAGEYEVKSTVPNYNVVAAPLVVKVTVKEKKSDDKKSEDKDSNDDSEDDRASKKVKKAPRKAPTSNSTMQAHSIEWLKGTGTTAVIDGNTLNVKPTKNDSTQTSAVLQVNFSKGGQEGYMKAGDVEIRIPRYIYRDREGNGVGNISIPLSEAPKKEGNTGFNYRIEGDEVVISNYKDISNSYMFTAQIKYDVTPYWVQNGYSNDKIQASFHVAQEGGESMKEVSDSLSVNMTTSTNSPSGNKTSTKYEKWQSAWGEKPEDADDYFYLVWGIWAYHSDRTQPYTVTVKDTPSDTYGEIVGYFKGTSTSSSSNFVKTDNIEDFNTSDAAKVGETTPKKAGDTNTYRYVVMRYKREDILKAQKENKDQSVISNGYEITITPLDDKTPKMSSGKATYFYKEVDMGYKGHGLSVGKSGYRTQYGGINALEADNDVNLGDFSISIEGRGYDLTGGVDTKTKRMLTEEELKDITLKEYETRLDDSKLVASTSPLDSYAFEELNEDDYTMKTLKNLKFDEYGFTISDESGVLDKSNSDYSTYGYVELYAHTRGSSGWTKLGEVRRTSSGYTYSGGGSASSIALPEGTTRISLRHHGTQFKVNMSADVQIDAHPTEHMKSIIKGKSDQYFYNYDSGVIGQDGKYLPWGSNGYPTRLGAHDTSEYGVSASHDYGYAYITRLNPSSSMGKSCNSKSQDDVNARARAQFIVYQYDSINADSSFTNEDLIKLGVLKEKRDGTFYDLLPTGTTVDVKSIKVRTYNGSRYYGQAVNYSVEYVDNWRNSGRTMMIVHATVPDSIQTNVYSSGSSRYTGMTLDYTLVDTYENMADYGKTIRNGAAYQSNDGAIAQGLTDNGGKIRDKEYFKDLDGNGSEDQEKNFMYAEASATFDPLLAAELGFKKAVKTPTDLEYGNATETFAGGDYSYQLRFANAQKTEAEGVIMFDVLEVAYPGTTPHWQGNFKGVNVQQLISKGIAPQVYYSTADFNNSVTAASFANLSNTAIWSPTAPADLSKVTAIAIDCSKGANGEKYVFKPEEVGLAYIQMSAPKNVTGLTDDPSTEADESVYAYNSAYLQAKTKPQGSTDEPVEKTEECSRVTVKVRKPEAAITKTADPATGTKDKPAKVDAESELTYNLAVQNKEASTAIDNVVVQDTISSELEIDTANIKYYVGDSKASAKLISTSDFVNLKQSGQSLTFTIANVKALETIHILVPTKVKPSSAGKMIENTSKITKIGETNVDINSSTTYHKTKFNVTVQKKWNDRDNKFKTRANSIQVQLVADGKDVSGKTATLNEANEWTFTFEDVEKYNSEGKEIVYTVKETKVPNGYTKDEKGLVVTNTANIEEGGEVEFKVKKLRTNSDIVVPGAVFVLKDGNGKEAYTATTDSNGVATFKVKPSVQAAGESYTLAEKSAPSGYTKSNKAWNVTFNKNETPNVTLDGNIFKVFWNWAVSADEYKDGQLVVYNDYDASGAWTPTATKVLTGRDLDDKEFSFTVKEGDEVVATGSNNKDGSISFSSIQYGLKDVGKHTYTITENKGNNASIDYSTQSYEVTVNVKDNLDGTLKAEESLPDTGVVFQNTYSAKPTSFALIASKQLTGNKTMEADMFSFELVDQDGKVVQTKKNQANGFVQFDAIKYDKAGEYKYTIREVKGSLSGVTYDTNEFNVVVKVTDDKKGQLHAESIYPEGGAVFKNSYKAAGTSVDLKAKKTLTGNKSLEKEMFTFTISENGKVLETVKNDEKGNVNFSTIQYDQEGEHTYTIAEVKENLSGVTYDTNTYDVKVKVVDDHNGKLQATVTYPNKDGIVFENSYKAASTSAKIHASKVLKGNKPLKEGMFKFTISENGKVLETVENDADGNIDFSSIKYTEDGTHEYTIAEVAGDLSGVTYQTEPVKVSVVVTDDLKGQLHAKVNYPKDGAVFNNSYKAASIKASVKASKSLTGNKPLEKGMFKFTISENGKVLETVENGENGSIAFTSIQYDVEGTHTYTIAEVKEDLSGVTYDANTYDVVVEVTDDLEGQLVAKVNYPDDKDIVFKNSYKAASTSAKIHASKVLKGNKPLKEGMFKFTLSENGKVLETVENDAEGNIDFSSIKYTDDGTYKYTISEVAGDLSGVTYQTEPVKVSVVVTDDLKGQLHAKVNYPKDGAVFNNSYKAASIKASVKASKSLTGNKPLEKGMFKFTISENGKVLETVENGENGSIAFTSIQYDVEGTHTYTIAEVKEDLSGVTYDANTYDVVVEVTDDLEGQLVAKVNYPDDKDIVFKNSYKAASTSAKIHASKVLKGNKPLKEGMFKFTLSENGEVLETVENDAEGNIDFSSIKYTDDGTYKYTIAEVEEDLSGVTYDANTYDVEVVVTDDLEGQLHAKVNYPEEKDVVFENSYQAASTKASISANKVIKGKLPLEKDMFSFVLKDSEGNEVETVQNDEDGNIQFAEIEYKKDGEYEYTISEVKGDLGGVTYVEDPLHVKVIVTDDLEGQLHAKVEYADGQTFENTYKASKTYVQLEADKTLSGNKPLSEGLFKFTLSENDEVLQTVENDKDGHITFDAIEYAEEGEHTYTIAEVKEDLNGVTYDENTYEVQVNVTDNLKGQMVADVTYPEEGITFENSYKAKSTTVGLAATKVLEGNKTLEKDMFEFTLSEDGEVLQTVKNDEDGKVNFEEIEYDEVGTHTYTIAEVKGDLPGIEYDTHTYEVTVEIKDDLDGALYAIVTYPQEGVVFTNDYDIRQERELTLEATKELSGKALADQQFAFEVLEGSDVVATGKNKADGSIEMSSIAYMKAGQHEYVIREVNDQQKNVTYDTNEYKVVVDVIDQGDGTLKTEVSYPNGKVTFKNTYKNTSKETKKLSKKVSGTLTGLGTNTTLWVVVAIAAILIVLFVIRSRKGK